MKYQLYIVFIYAAINYVILFLIIIKMILNVPFFLCIHTDIHIYYTTSFHFKSLHGVLLHTFLLEWEKGTGSIPVVDRWCNECLHCSFIIPFCRDLPWNVPHPHLVFFFVDPVCWSLPYFVWIWNELMVFQVDEDQLLRALLCFVKHPL